MGSHLAIAYILSPELLSCDQIFFFSVVDFISSSPFLSYYTSILRQSAHHHIVSLSSLKNPFHLIEKIIIICHPSLLNILFLTTTIHITTTSSLFGNERSP